MVTKLAIAGILSLVTTISSYAHDSDRIEQLEREVGETKQRLTILESKLRKKIDQKELVITDDGWKSVGNWRKLTTGMSTSAVKKYLANRLGLMAEPSRTGITKMADLFYLFKGKLIAGQKV